MNENPKLHAGEMVVSPQLAPELREQLRNQVFYRPDLPQIVALQNARRSLWDRFCQPALLILGLASVGALIYVVFFQWK